MSHCIDETYEFYTVTLRCARKAHTCDACRESIEPGHRYYTVALAFEGDFESIKRCCRCEAIHRHLRKIEPGELWPAERLDCGEEYRDHWGEDPPPEIAALAFALPGEVRP